jgi:cytochrome c oxidase subunit 3
VERKPMSSEALQPAHQFETVEQQNATVTLGMWAFLLNEVLFFGGLFTVYAMYRAEHYTAFARSSAKLDPVLGGINTAILIGSSLTVALAVWAAHEKRRGLIVPLLGMTSVLGLAFLGIKVVEYSHKFHEHLVPGHGFAFDMPFGSELFFALYFVMTGMHALHMVIGIIIFAVLMVVVMRGRESSRAIEVAGLYWHFVDIVWIFLFPLLYLIGRHAA